MIKAFQGLKLGVESGPRAGETVVVEHSPFTIGRDRSADLFLDDSTVSRTHGAFVQRNGDWILQDMGGRNPPSVHGRPVISLPVEAGDRIQLGQTIIVVQEVGGVAVTRPTDGDTVEVPAQRVVQSPRRAAQLAGRPLWEVLESWTGVIRNLDEQGSHLDTILDGFRRVIPADRIAIYRRGDSGVLACIATRNLEGEEPLDYSETIVARVIQEKVAKLFSPRIEEGIPRSRSMIRKQIRTALCIPLLSRGEVWGIVYMDQVEPDQPPLLPSDLELGTLLGHWVAEAMEKAERFREMDREILRLKKGQDTEVAVLVGDSASLKEVRRRMRKVAKTDVSVLVSGESGTGKELVAQGIHRHSARRERPFVPINCAAIPDNLVESELFGYSPRSGIHGADPAGKPGKFEQASDGTIFLDEIGELALSVQAKLLRVLENRVVDRIGGREPIPVDVRVVAATNRDLHAEVEAGRFREDLYYRLRVFPIAIPPLRERPEDLLPLTSHLLEELVEDDRKVRVTPRAIEMIRNHHWPGNVRELKNVLLEALLLGDGRSVAPRDLPSLSAPDSVAFQSLREVERKHIVRVLEGVNWNKKKAAEVLGIHRSTLYEKIAEYQLEPQAPASKS